MEKRYSMEDFIKIVKALRSENGCPWDRKQTHESLKPCMMEEAAEFVSSIRIYDKTGSAENMREELGDILLQVVMHAQIAEEEELFTLEDVIHDISAKMVRRHPHVFAEAQAEGIEGIRESWDEIKKKEKEGKEWLDTPLREIPRELPALTRAPKVLKKVDKLYEPGKDYYTDVMNLESSIRRLMEYQPEEESAKLKEIMSDMLIDLSDIARQFKIAQEQILTDRIEEIIDKYEPGPGCGKNLEK